MRLISTVFIICLFGKLINCNTNNDQTKSAPAAASAPAVSTAIANAIASEKTSQPAQQPAAESNLKLESRQVVGSPHQYADRSDASVQHVAINTHNLSPKETAYHNAHPNAPIGYIQIQPMLAPLSSHHTPEQQGSTTFLSFIKPQQAGGRRSFSLTSKLKNIVSSLFWKDTSSSTPYMASGSSYSFAFKQPPPFNFVSQNQAPNYAAASQYKPVVFAPNNGGYNNKYASSFNSGPQYGSAAAASSGYQSMQPAPGSYYSSGGQGGGGFSTGGMNGQGMGSQAMNSNMNSNMNNNGNNMNGPGMNNMNTGYLRNNGMFNGGNTGFSSSSYQFPSDAQASGSNAVNTYASAYPNSNAQQAAANSNAAYGSGAAANYNQRLSAESAAPPAATRVKTATNPFPNADSSSSSSAVSSALTGNQATNPVSLLKNGKPSFGSY